MYDIKRLEAGQQKLQLQQAQQPPLGLDLSGQQQQLTCSVITAPAHRANPNPNSISSFSSSSSCSSQSNPSEATHMTLLTLRRRRSLQRRACLLSILAAFVFGMALGVVVPMFGLPRHQDSPPDLSEEPIQMVAVEPLSSYRVEFIKETDELSAEQVFRNAFHLEQDKNAPDSMVVKKLDTNDGSIKEFHVQRTASGRYRKGPERRLSKMMPERVQPQETLRSPATSPTTPTGEHQAGLIEEDVYWGATVEQALPKGFAAKDQVTWERFVGEQGRVVRLEQGCGRMQNRLVVFADGTRACARYRQNTDQIQGEIFSYYLGQLLNISNLAPSAATVVDTSTPNWAAALGDITQAQWKERRPVVLTRWLADLEPAGIPQPFQPLERHLNKHDVWNLTRHMQSERQTQSQSPLQSQSQPQGLLKRLGAASSPGSAHQSNAIEETGTGTDTETETASNGALVQRLIELAQWSDLIVFDYLIANLDRVVNNLYNFQWNADIMAAPAHNLARQSASQLLVFLDNESGLLHGYRLLKKYEAYHSLLLDNLCVFRRPTIDALRRLRAAGAGRRLRDLFERTTSAGVRDVLPSLPDKSVKILVERIDRVLGQVQKCQGS
ncbi:extracellular serine/threonine protein kinase four-jointed [Drosophila teissieri]|uniref:extracellular serine/threonine protein kinase four-jointed n=1 Tax=Drosophila teissieri TaxID=7243 RepID=UPI001CB9EFF9|nr:extracellular serine/threonine protein kinase four-jointed [Drosophila teissieri]